MARKSGALQNCRLVYWTNYIFLRWDHKLKVILICHRLQHSTWVPRNLRQESTESRTAHTARLHTILLSVMLLRNHDDAVILYIKKNSVSIVWGTTKYPPATPSIGVATVNGSTTQAYVPMDSNRTVVHLKNLHLLSMLLLLKQQQCLWISSHPLYHIIMYAYWRQLWQQ